MLKDPDFKSIRNFVRVQVGDGGRMGAVVKRHGLTVVVDPVEEPCEMGSLFNPGSSGLETDVG